MPANNGEAQIFQMQNLHLGRKRRHRAHAGRGRDRAARQAPCSVDAARPACRRRGPRGGSGRAARVTRPRPLCAGAGPPLLGPEVRCFGAAFSASYT